MINSTCSQLLIVRCNKSRWQLPADAAARSASDALAEFPINLKQNTATVRHACCSISIPSTPETVVHHTAQFHQRVFTLSQYKFVCNEGVNRAVYRKLFLDVVNIDYILNDIYFFSVNIHVLTSCSFCRTFTAVRQYRAPTESPGGSCDWGTVTFKIVPKNFHYRC